MSFVRPELAEAFARRREVILWAAALVLGLWLIWRGYVRVDALVLVVGMALAATGFALLAGALARLRLAATAPAPGVVMVDEGRIGLFGPAGGGFVDLSTLISVAVSGRPGSEDRAWMLRSEDGGVLVVPFGAVGAERIPDALASLPGSTSPRPPRARGRSGRRRDGGDRSSASIRGNPGAQRGSTTMEPGLPPPTRASPVRAGPAVQAIGPAAPCVSAPCPGRPLPRPSHPSPYPPLAQAGGAG